MFYAGTQAPTSSSPDLIGTGQGRGGEMLLALRHIQIKALSGQAGTDGRGGWWVCKWVSMGKSKAMPCRGRKLTRHK